MRLKATDKPTAGNSPATEVEDLREGSSVWAGGKPRSRPLTSSFKTDVVVVGAGVTGAFVAQALSHRYDVTIVDRRWPAAGSTSASTAMLQWEIDTPLVDLNEKSAAQFPPRLAEIFSREPGPSASCPAGEHSMRKRRWPAHHRRHARNDELLRGDGGNGTVYSMIATQIVPTLLRGKQHVDADLYRFRQ